jgi:hypothetical protein
MKVTATATLTATQVCCIYDRLAKLVPFSWLMEGGYCTPSLTISDNGSFNAVGQSCAANFCSIEFDATHSLLKIEINSRRHALLDEGNSAGAVFGLLRMGLQCNKDGECHSPLDLNILERFKIQEYSSWRKDVPFWECNLTRSSKMDAQKEALSEYFRKFRHDIWRDHFLNYDPDRKILVFHTSEEGVEHGRPATYFLDGIDFRRLAAEGIVI